MPNAPARVLSRGRRRTSSEKSDAIGPKLLTESGTGSGHADTTLAAANAMRSLAFCFLALVALVAVIAARGLRRVDFQEFEGTCAKDSGLAYIELMPGFTADRPATKGGPYYLLLSVPGETQVKLARARLIGAGGPIDLAMRDLTSKRADEHLPRVRNLLSQPMNAPYVPYRFEGVVQGRNALMQCQLAPTPHSEWHFTPLDVVMSV